MLPLQKPGSSRITLRFLSSPGKISTLKMLYYLRDTEGRRVQGTRVRALSPAGQFPTQMSPVAMSFGPVEADRNSIQVPQRLAGVQSPRTPSAMPLGLCIGRKLESGVELGLEAQPPAWDTGVLTGSVRTRLLWKNYVSHNHTHMQPLFCEKL